MADTCFWTNEEGVIETCVPVVIGYVEQQIIPGVVAGQGYGWAIAIDGDYAVVGGYYGSTSGVWVYKRAASGLWGLQQTLNITPTGAAFGESVAISGDTIVVGQPSDDVTAANSGAAYVFLRTGDTWAEQQKLKGTTVTASNVQGESVAIDGDNLVVGGSFGGGSGGTVHYWTRSGVTWTQQQELSGLVLDGEVGGFGKTLAMSGNYLIVGAPYSENAAALIAPGDNDAGGAYIFLLDSGSWTLQQRLLPLDGQNDERFGFRVGISPNGQYAIVSAVELDDDEIIFQGSVKAYIYQRSGATWTQTAALNPQLYVDSSDVFADGVNVAINDDWAAVSDHLDPTDGSESGMVYLYRRDGPTWNLYETITPSDPAANRNFGSMVAFGGTDMVVGAFKSGSFLGQVYFFGPEALPYNFVEPTYDATLVAGTPEVGAEFGVGMRVDGDYMIVGSAQQDSAAGRAYVFHRSAGTWTEQEELSASDGAAADTFGYAVDISGDWAVAGAEAVSTGGQAYFFSRSGASWTEQEIVAASDGAAGDGFGYAVAIHGDYAAIGAYGHEDALPSEGAVYIFKRSGSNWTEIQKISNPFPAEEAYFGSCVHYDGTTLVAGGWSDGTDGGVMYVYTRSGDTFTYQADLATPLTLSAGDGLGDSCRVDGDTIALGAPGDDGSKGAAYVLTGAGATWTQQAKLVGSTVAAMDQTAFGLDLSGDIILIGNTATDTGQGVVYRFERSAGVWVETAVFNNASGDDYDAFGRAVAIAGAQLLTGEPYGGSPDNGAVIVFEQ